ncbi:hypothetical protein AG1IA_05246 [Rhizoctonia solani AG-1 IA]|uniref:Uncharacterized protein n=1 Tax=Thanatephorus cucumeris (strain AG1-IA) TaxID=983506 RepID=L8WVB1_THACA|nr:hypothetical protein AG1IA_05246 [Rhizoctonia solani AG-1 IA]
MHSFTWAVKFIGMAPVVFPARVRSRLKTQPDLYHDSVVWSSSLKFLDFVLFASDKSTALFRLNMYSKSIAALYALVLAGAAAAQSTMTVATPPSVVQCQPVQLSWSGGTAPYFPSIIPGQQAGSPALKEFPSQTGTSLTWTVDLIASTYITLPTRLA